MPLRSAGLCGSTESTMIAPSADSRTTPTPAYSPRCLAHQAAHSSAVMYRLYGSSALSMPSIAARTRKP